MKDDPPTAWMLVANPSVTTPRVNSLGYRPDIDGLRAVAVLAIVVYHVQQNALPGGYVGVDIFFTISGFLITHIVCTDLNQDRFSLLEFYRRRVKRIAPAMLVIVAATTVAAQLLMLPEDARDAAKSAFWSVASMANVFFWREQDTGYFAVDSEQLPLLHLWSLGVEEQFYLLWPLVLWLFYRRTRGPRLTYALGAVALASFGLGQALFDRDPLFTYYMLPTRAGELLVGAILAIESFRGIGQTLPRRLVPLTAVGGLSLMLLACSLLNTESRFPGWLALPPTLGTALVILAGLAHSSSVSRVLGSRPLVWIGQLSYSIYLWHWPLLALYRYGYGAIGVLSGASIVGATCLLSWVTFRYVEVPFRRAEGSPLEVITRLYLVPAGAMGLLLLALIYPGQVGIALSSSAYEAARQQFRQTALPASGFDRVCQSTRTTPEQLTNVNCIVGADLPGEPSIVLWGDSNAAHYVGMLEEFGRAAGFHFRNIEVGSCPPVDGDPAPFVPAVVLASCRASLELIRPAIEKYSVVVISATWTSYHRVSASFLPAAFQTIERLAASGKRVILLGKVPEISGYDRLCWEKSLRYPLLICTNIVAAPSAEITSLNEQLRQLAETVAGVEYFEVTRYVCPGNRCSTLDSQGMPKYFDSGHLSMQGSIALGRQIVAADGVPDVFTNLAGH